MFNLETLPNGLKLLVAPAIGTEAATVLVLVKVGSRYETRELSGASHFIEHMMFKGTKKFPKARDLSRMLEQYGADYNAFTNRDRTGYYVKIAGSRLQTGIELIHDMLANSVFAPGEMQKERGVIIEEINMYEDNPRMHVGDLLEEATYGDTPLGWNIAGTKETMMAMTRPSLLDYREKNYHPARIAVVLAGAVSEDCIKFARKLFGSIKAKGNANGKFMLAPAFLAHDKPSIRMQKKEAGQVQLAMAFPGVSITSDNLPALRLLSAIFGEGMSSRLFEAVREKRGLAYSVGSGVSSLEDTGMFSIGAGLAKKEYQKAGETIVKEIEKMCAKGPTEKELAQAKTRLEGGMLLALEDSSDRAAWYAQELLFGQGKVRTPAERLAEFMKVTRADVLKTARETFDMKKISIGAIGPFASEEAVIKPFI
ncbi:MAG: pitrilysin family protein [bacterium]